MSDKPISVGDLVMIVKAKPCWHGRVGLVFRVEDIDRSCGINWCSECRATWGPYPQALFDGGSKGATLNRLKRIPPPEELGIVDEKTEEPSHVG